MSTTVEFPDLFGHTMSMVAEEDYQLTFIREDGKRFRFFHEQDCCESVRIEEIVGDLNDLVGSPILQAEEIVDEAFENSEEERAKDYDSHTWTFYKFATNKGSVTVRWLGESNGYYSERVEFGEF